GGQGSDRRDRRRSAARRGPDWWCAEGRALRDRRLRHPGRPGQAAWLQGGPAADPRDPRGREGHRREADPARGAGRQPARRAAARCCLTLPPATALAMLPSPWPARRPLPRHGAWPFSLHGEHMNDIERIATPALLALAIAGLTACGQDRNDADMAPGVPDTSAADPAAQPPGATDPAFGDSQATPEEAAALGVLNAINEHEIAAGEQALAKGDTGATADHARLMIDQHTQNRTQTSAFGPDEQAQDAQAQRQKGEQERATLDQLDGEAYRKAYVDAMVK